MKLFIDSANTCHIKEINALGIICGVTTNPSLIAKEGRDFAQTVREIAAVVDGPISAEVLSPNRDEMVGEGRKLAQIHKNIVIKVPMTLEGLAAAHMLAELGIRTNVTLVFSSTQALMAARAGAAFVSPFVGRLDDHGEDGVALIRDVAEIFDIHGIKTEIIAASIRHPVHVSQSALAGAHIATVPYNVIVQMSRHPLTDIGIERFNKDWESAGLVK